MKQLGKSMAEFFKKETVLCIAALLAVVSMFLVPPDSGYKEYIDYNVLGLLFSLMVVTSGLGELGVFDKIARVILKKANRLRSLCLLMVALCFFSSMLITNDVALLTFVPFTILLLSMAGLSEYIVAIVVYETVAANMGSMLTPVGNPQNLYLYTASGMGLAEFLMVTAPITILSGVLLLGCCFFMKNKPVHIVDKSENGVGKSLKEMVKTDTAGDTETKADCVENTEIKKKAADGKISAYVLFYTVFGLALFAVLKWIPVYVPFLMALCGTYIIRKGVLKKVDYCLLLTFVSFFVFIGNMGRIEAVSNMIAQLLEGRELLVAFLSSQVISNVPAAMLLSGFTTDFAALIKGTNIGGLGTLIASLASLISYKYVVQALPEKKGKYFLYFTLVNVLFAIVLLVFTFLIG